METNLFDCSEDLYGKQAEVSLLKFLRPEQKFASIDALKNQLDHDVAAGKKYVEKSSLSSETLAVSLRKKVIQV